MPRVRVIYRGRVQGVGFRWTCANVAQSHPVTGWVRNEPDGTVQLEAQGERQAIDDFLEAINDRMAGNIHKRTVEPIGDRSDESSFHIAR